MNEAETKKIKGPPHFWGLTQEAVLQKLQGRRVVLRMADGGELSGTLIGYNDYSLTLADDDGLVCVINKGHIVRLDSGLRLKGAKNEGEAKG